MTRPNELTFAPLGGVGQIGMNLSIYGLAGKWLAIDLGVYFGDEEHLPGIDLVMPDVRFLERKRRISSVSCSPTPMRTISAPSSTCGPS